MKQNKKPKINTYIHFYHPFITTDRHCIANLSPFYHVLGRDEVCFSFPTSIQFFTYNFSTVYANFVFFIWLDSAQKNKGHIAEEMSKMDTKISRIEWKQTQHSPQITNPKPLFIHNYICMRA